MRSSMVAASADIGAFVDYFHGRNSDSKVMNITVPVLVEGSASEPHGPTNVTRFITRIFLPAEFRVWGNIPGPVRYSDLYIHGLGTLTVFAKRVILPKSESHLRDYAVRLAASFLSMAN